MCQRNISYGAPDPTDVYSGNGDVLRTIEIGNDIGRWAELPAHSWFGCTLSLDATSARNIGEVSKARITLAAGYLSIDAVLLRCGTFY